VTARRHLWYVLLYAMYQVPLFVMVEAVTFGRGVYGVRIGLELTALAVFIMGFYGSIYWYCDKLKEM